MFHRLSRVATLAIEQRPALVVWLLAALATVHLLTIAISPTVWQDEVQIVDLGRDILAPDPSMSLGWTARQRPVSFVNYLGPVLQEVAYRASAPSIVGPRLSTLLGAIVAAYLMFLWLRARRAGVGPALGLSVVFFLDPIFVQGYRGARVDSWVFALVLLACILVRRSADGPASGEGVARRLVVPSTLMVVAFFVWPSAIYLIPLVVAEAVLTHTPLRVPVTRVLSWGLAAIAGAILGMVLCLIPMIGQLPTVLSDTLITRDQYYRAVDPVGHLIGAVWNMVLSFQQSPLVPVAALAAAVSRRNRVLAAATAVAVLSMLPTMMYVHRVVYLLPYLIGLIGEGWPRVDESRPRAWPRVAMAAMLVLAGSISLVARPALAFMTREARNSALWEEAALQMPELRFQRLYLEPWEFYYVGRRLGWKMVRPYGDIGSAAYAAMFSGLDYALLTEAESARRRGFFAAMDWHLIHQIVLPSVQAEIPGRAAARPRHFDLYSRWPRQPPISALAP